ncbi:YgfZ/GcvT domain-containing protein [Pseudochelatococcus lubricantis]|uniref:CAF17-like 4Fe-4S cluster assembly/insertion protein YgfZ n=1 Tax=Pseudochelatococcus lubricantis TaxID=1538102 RepID=UPI0035EF2DF6
MPKTFLADRGVVKVVGEEARHFLQNLVTSHVENLAPGEARWFGLLTPQGKILFDGLAVAMPEERGGFLLDVARDQAETLARRLNFYKLRAKVIVEDLSETLGVGVVWGDDAPPAGLGIAFTDPRLAELGTRIVAERERVAALGDDAAAWHAHRVRLGVPEGGKDFPWGDAFPHEVLMDQLQGVAFDKGCYVGQEVVSRMHHRKTARTRIVPVTFDGAGPAEGADVLTGGKVSGRVGTAIPGRALASLRLDRAAEAIAAGEPVTADGVALTLDKPAFIRFPFPGEEEPPHD